MITSKEFAQERQQLATVLADKFIELLAEKALSKGYRKIEFSISNTYSTNPNVEMLMRDAKDMEKYVKPILDDKLKKYGWKCTLKHCKKEPFPEYYYMLEVFPL